MLRALVKSKKILQSVLRAAVSASVIGAVPLGDILRSKVAAFEDPAVSLARADGSGLNGTGFDWTGLDRLGLDWTAADGSWCEWIATHNISSGKGRHRNANNECNEEREKSDELHDY
ncbi:hypothetical protein K458DRAFT_390530 [Lentithecium fluviatile CBS 122367]|uniref:Uncharacterized protein n=1 Tax=Lentithecium fluviatile CBS 122367 TaxID=1168545 RepID=A0A6G1IWH5_9PLEO|nr:hypothetical protein K458DRAFT_390530 [Lentithecium fluviatile CBS 122367]